MIKAVIFDMDGLMFDSERIVQMSWTHSGKNFGYESLGDNIVNTLGMNRKRRRVYFAEKYGETFPFDAFQEGSTSFFRSYVKENGLPVKHGLESLLLYLKEKGYKMGVATSSSRLYAESSIERANLTHYFDQILCGDMVENGKPDPEIYIKACQLLQVSPEEALALEDSPNGIKAAHLAGIGVIMVPDILPYSAEFEPYLLTHCKDLTEVKNYIENQLK